MNLRHLESFLAVLRHGSYREAATRTGTSQPALSQHIRKLEAELCAGLIQRQHSGCTPTLEGLALVPYAESLLRTEQRARAHFRDRSLGIGAGTNIGVYLLPAYLKNFRTLKPETEIELTVDNNTAIAGRLKDAQIEVAIMEWWDGRRGFTAHPWRCEELVLIIPPDHRWADRTQIRADSLRGCDLLGGEPGSGTGRIIADQLGEIADTLQISAQLGSTEAVKRAVAAGLGMSLVLASSVRHEVEAGHLHALQVDGARLEKQLYIVTRDTCPPQSPAQVFVDHLLGQEPLDILRTPHY
ncbi:LysR family transcriptional regulator [Guyparkeria sp. 1SP6A2]|nr:LysR family transcriptional regulator [Guyparkeria sp. 1SP6A2]